MAGSEGGALSDDDDDDTTLEMFIVTIVTTAAIETESLPAFLEMRRAKKGLPISLHAARI